MVVDKIAEYIEKQGIKQSAIANYLEIHPQTMSDIINGKRKLKADEYIDICDFLNVPYDQFVDNRSS